MRETACTDMRFCTLVEAAGHWVQQEAPERVIGLLREFLDLLRCAPGTATSEPSFASPTRTGDKSIRSRQRFDRKWSPPSPI